MKIENRKLVTDQYENVPHKKKMKKKIRKTEEKIENKIDSNVTDR